MSGFAAVVHLDGAPVVRNWLETMADFLVFRGPDAREVWVSGSIGLCHTFLRTSAETAGRSQIASLNGNLWIAGDVRVDDRENLIAKLPRKTFDPRTAGSAELILHAYAAWGPACVENLLGDFSFAIWDARQRRIFAARDQMGVRPLYYALVGQCLLISNTQDCIRQIRIVPDRLNDRAIGDFLLVGHNKYPAETFFAAIQRLPAAHRLSAGSDGVRTERYWTMPIDEPVYYKRTRDYVDHFHELTRAAVRDRLPDGPLVILMSGGLDSPLLAATAVQLGAATTAFTSVYERLIPDEERHYAGLVAQHLGIPISYWVKDDEPWGWEPGSAPVRTPEPSPDPLNIVSFYQYNRELSAHARVFFFGLGPDTVLSYEWTPYLDYLIRRRRWGRLALDLISDFIAQPRVLFLHRLRQTRRERRIRDCGNPTFPSWFNKEFEARMHLRDRWDEVYTDSTLPHPTRPQSYTSIAGDFPFGGVEDFDAGKTHVPADFRHPFFDIRLLRFLLTVPAMPWCRNKYLIRTALRGLIPEAVRLRPKAPLNGTPYLERINRSQYPALPPAPGLANYVDRNQVGTAHGVDREEIDEELRILGLQLWLLTF